MTATTGVTPRVHYWCSHVFKRKLVPPLSSSSLDSVVVLWEVMEGSTFDCKWLLLPSEEAKAARLSLALEKLHVGAAELDNLKPQRV